MPLALPDAALETLAAATSALDNPPLRVGVVLDAPAIDCDQLTVHIASLELVLPQEQTPFASAAMRPRATMATFIVTLAECVPTGAKPKIERIQEAALKIQTHAAAVWFALAVHDFGGCRAYSLGQALPLPESGGYAGFLIPVTVQVEP